MANPANEVGFNILRATGATGGTFAIIAKAPANATTYLDASAVSATQYRYQVSAYNNAGTSAASNTILVTTAATVALPAVPALTAPAASATVSKVTRSLSVGVRLPAPLPTPYKSSPALLL